MEKDQDEEYMIEKEDQMQLASSGSKYSYILFFNVVLAVFRIEFLSYANLVRASSSTAPEYVTSSKTREIS